MNKRGVNLVATLGTMFGDAVAQAVIPGSGMAGAAPAGLVALLGEPGLSVDAFAQILGITGSGGVRLVDRLLAAGLVERRPGKDARAVSLWLTPAGEAAGDQVLQARRQVVTAATATLSRADQAALVRIAEQILAAVTKDRAHAEWLCRMCDLGACPQQRCPISLAAP